MCVQESSQYSRRSFQLQLYIYHGNISDSTMTAHALPPQSIPTSQSSFTRIVASLNLRLTSNNTSKMSHNDLADSPSKEAPMAELERFRTSNTVTMTPELFEKLYLGPQNNVKGDLRKTFGNPTPLGLVGFLVALTPLACCLMGWRGSGGLGAANM